MLICGERDSGPGRLVVARSFDLRKARACGHRQAAGWRRGDVIRSGNRLDTVHRGKVGRAELPPKESPETAYAYYAPQLRRWMVILDDDRSAALVIRVWLEGQADHFRSRLTAADTSPGSTPGDEVTVAVVSSPREVTDAVSQWLQDFVRDAPKQIDSD